MLAVQLAQRVLAVPSSLRKSAQTLARNYTQILYVKRSDFATKLDKDLIMIHDVNKDVRDFSGHMDLANLAVSNNLKDMV